MNISCYLVPNVSLTVLKSTVVRGGSPQSAIVFDFANYVKSIGMLTHYRAPISYFAIDVILWCAITDQSL